MPDAQTIADAVADAVAQRGQVVLSVNDHDPAFAYTVGLSTGDHAGPELVLFGLGDLNGQILKGLSVMARAGEPMAAGGRFARIVEHGALVTRAVDPTQHPFYLGHAMEHCRDRRRIGGLHAVQVFWPDMSGRYPFDPGCVQRVRSLQPRLDLPLSADEVQRRRAAAGF